jgi:formylglycine-generating enzyme required for sulfatase activity
MNGNVGQWCWDWFEYNLRSGQNDPRGASSGDTRVIRGGSWLDAARNARVANRSFHTPAYQYIDLGFRLVRQ